MDVKMKESQDNRVSTSSRRLAPMLQLVLLIIAAGMLLGMIMLAPLSNITQWGIDGNVFRAGAKALRLGESPYDEPAILRHADGGPLGNIHNFVYAPFFAWLLGPLSWLSAETGLRLWFAANLIMYFASALLLLNAIDWKPTPKAFLVLMLALAAFPPLRTALIIGQSTIFLLFWFALSYFLLKRNRALLSGLALSLSFFKPHLLLLVPFYLIKRQWRVLIGWGIGVVLSLLPFWYLLGDWRASVASAYQLNRATGGCLRMVSITTLVGCFSPAGIATVIFWALSFVLIGGAFWLASRRNTPQHPSFDRDMALILCVTALALDNIRIADQVLLLLPLLVILRDWPKLANRRQRLWQAAMLGAVFIIPYALDLLQGRDIAYILPLWYAGVSLAITLALLQLYRLPPASTPPLGAPTEQETYVASN
jgi:hypothetical protein